MWAVHFRHTSSEGQAHLPSSDTGPLHADAGARGTQREVRRGSAAGKTGLGLEATCDLKRLLGSSLGPVEAAQLAALHVIVNEISALDLLC